MNINIINPSFYKDILYIELKEISNIYRITFNMYNKENNLNYSIHEDIYTDNEEYIFEIYKNLLKKYFGKLVPFSSFYKINKNFVSLNVLRIEEKLFLKISSISNKTLHTDTLVELYFSYDEYTKLNELRNEFYKNMFEKENSIQIN